MLDGGKGEAVFEAGEGAMDLVQALHLSSIQKGSDHLIRGDDGVNTLRKGVEKDDFLANYPDNLQVVPAISVDVLWNGRSSTHSIDLTLCKNQSKNNQKQALFKH